ncbi:Fe2+-dicitrate sensor protein [Pseudomonas syringae group genomosp. 3]|nr:Fe2+-dicitrate sensor protein [Pseudomonas syringae group genomosp. 3]
MNNPRTDHYDVLQQAAAWYARLGADNAGDSDRRKWERWLNQNEEHRKAWALVEKVGARFAHFHEPAEQNGAYKALQPPRSSLLSRRQTLLSLSVIAMGGILGWQASKDSISRNLLASALADLSTSTGETQAFTLADGTRIWLNTASALNVTIAPDVQALQLLKGEVLIDATRSRTKRTQVKTLHGKAQAYAAEFSARLLNNDATCITVYSGVVSVMAAGQHCDVYAGQQISLYGDRLDSPQPASASGRAWTSGMLVAEGMPLLQFVSELSRYRHGYLACDEKIAGLRVAGTFSVKDTDRALAALASALPVTIRRTLPWWVTVEARA